MSFNNYLPSDVIALKQRIAPWVTLVDENVARTPTIARDDRAGWRSFVGEWNAFLAEEGTFFSPQRYARGLELEAKLRDWRSALSSQCPGVPAPAPKRATSFFGTWASPSDIRAQKVRVDPLLRDINERVVACPTVDPALQKAWGAFFRAWTLFFNQEDEWIHGATQLECAQAYEDSISEWREAVERGCRNPATPNASDLSSSPGQPVPSVPPAGLPPWTMAPPASALGPDQPNLGANLFVSFAMLGLGFAIAKARTR